MKLSIVTLAALLGAASAQSCAAPVQLSVRLCSLSSSARLLQFKN